MRTRQSVVSQKQASVFKVKHFAVIIYIWYIYGLGQGGV